MLGHVVGAEDPRAFAAFEPASIAHDSLRNLAQAKRAEGQAASRAEKAAAQQRAALAAGEQSFSQQKGVGRKRGRAEAEALASGRAPEGYCGNLAVRFRGLGAWVCAEEGVDRGAYCIYGREPERLKVNR